MAVTDLLKADVGKVIFFGLLVGLPAASIPFTLRRGGHQNDETGTLH